MATRVLVLGATGYVGGRLVPRLLAAGHTVRCLARSPEKVRAFPWADDVELVRGDLLAGAEATAAFDDVDVVVHLVHSMGQKSGDFAAADRRIARTVASASAAAGVRRIVYLGGLGDVDGATSAHLRSRAEVADILTGGAVPTTVLRAAVIIGSGSASFEMLRHLTEKLPVMICPRWVDTKVQPVAIRDVLRYLVAAVGQDDGHDHAYDVGGPDVVTYRKMMQTFAQVAGLPRRLVISVPLLTPSLSSHWVNLVTPVPFGLARPLVESLVSEVVVRRDGEDVRRLDPTPCLPLRAALELALRRVRDHEIATSWREAGIELRHPAEPYPGDPAWTGGTLLQDRRTAIVRADASAVQAVVCRIGGDRGWPTHMWAWRLRGAVDLAVGGVGLRRGRRDPDQLRVGDALDFWRVEEVREPGGDDGEALVRLRAEMKLPGRAWLEFRVQPTDGGSTLVQRAMFAPKGLFGRLYWWVLVPFHGPIFSSMVRRIAADAEALGGAGLTSSGGPTAPREAPAAAAPPPPPAPHQQRRAG